MITTAADARRYVSERLNAGYAPSTVRKDLTRIRTECERLYAQGRLDAATLLEVQAVKPPRHSGQVRPQPYRRKELHLLWEKLDERWPRLPADDARVRLGRLKRGTGSYQAVRTHVIGLQLQTVIELALHAGLRRREISRFDVDDLDYRNEYLVVWHGKRWQSAVRSVPFTPKLRDTVQAWLDTREQLGVSHDHAWLKLWAAPRAVEPLPHFTFDKLLATYVGKGWSLKRLRDSCAANWIKVGMPLGEVQELLGLASIREVLPYAGAVIRHTDRRVDRLGLDFASAVT